jgi:tRNA A-37 threonylcarbamoyl transferase component Bud32
MDNLDERIKRSPFLQEAHIIYPILQKGLIYPILQKGLR